MITNKNYNKMAIAKPQFANVLAAGVGNTTATLKGVGSPLQECFPAELS